MLFVGRAPPKHQRRSDRKARFSDQQSSVLPGAFMPRNCAEASSSTSPYAEKGKRFGQKYPSGQVSPVIAPRLHEVAVAIGMAALVVAIIATRGGALMSSTALPLEGNHFGMLYLVLRVYGMSHTMLHVCRMVLCA